MAWETGLADNYLDLLEKLLRFLQAKGALSTPVYTGTGNGELLDFDTQPQAPTETWTLECSNATKVGVADYGASVAADTPVLHWRFNETSGTTAEDATANNIDGTISGSPTMGSTGLLSVDTNKAFTFDGVNDKVASAAVANVQLTGDAAIEVIVQPSAIDGTRFIAGVGANGTGNANNYLISLWLDEGFLKIYHEYGAGNIQQQTSGYKLEVGRKYHIVLSRDNANKTYKLIVGGILRHEFQYVFPASDGTSAHFAVGLSPDGLNPFAGVIDEAALYGAQISEATAASHAKDALGHETFSVTGSVSGAQAAATAGLPYKNAFIAFEITDGSVNFIVGDDWEIDVVQSNLGAQAWTINRREKDIVYLQGPGLSATDEIYCWIKTYFNATSDYYNWEVGAADGYTANANETGQPNVSPSSYVPLWNTAIPYWFVASGRRFMVIAKISTTYHGMYAGLYLPFATPVQFPYPMAIGGSSGVSTQRFSSTTSQSKLFSMPGLNCLFVRGLDGSWNAVSTTVSGTNNETNYLLHPYSATKSARTKVSILREALGGAYPLTPITIIDISESIPTTAANLTKGVVGELDGCFHISGFGNAAENLAQVDGIDFLVVQNVFRTDIASYFAMRLQ